MNLNILTLNTQKGYNPNLKRFLRKILKSKKYDFILLQEATENVVAMISGAKAYVHVSGMNDEVKEPAHLCIVYRKNFTLKESDLFTFAHIAPKVRLKHASYGLLAGIFTKGKETFCIGSVHLNAGLHPKIRRTELRRIEIKERMLERSKRARITIFGGDFNFGLPKELKNGAHILLPDFICMTKNVGPTLNSRYTEYVSNITNTPSFIFGKIGIGISLRADHIFVDKKTAKNYEVSARMLKDRVSDHSPVSLILKTKKS